jgi:hypothetical protein
MEKRRKLKKSQIMKGTTKMETDLKKRGKKITGQGGDQRGEERRFGD